MTISNFNQRRNPIVFILLAIFIFQITKAECVLAYCPPPTKYLGEGMTSSAPAKNDSGNVNKNSNEARAHDPVYLNSGEYSYSKQDLFIPVRGMPVEVTRIYLSQKDYNGPFGYGWFMNVNMRLKRIAGGKVVILAGNGRKDEYSYDSVNGVYLPPAGVYSNLIKNLDGTYTLTEKNGKKYNFDIEGRISVIEDRNANQMSFSYTPDKLPVIGPSAYFINQNEGVIAYDYQLTAITDSVGRSISFEYNAYGRLAKITDFIGREITYSYDQFGNLVSVKDAQGNLTQYAYDTQHNLLTITDGNGRTYLVNTYDSNDRFITQTYGGYISTSSYDQQARTDTSIDRRGHTVITTFDAVGNPVKTEEFTQGLRPEDPPSFLTTKEYNSNREIIRVVYPKENSVLYDYDDKGNVVSIIRKPLSSSTELPLITLFTYEPNYNFIKTTTDPKGSTTTYDYDAKGNLLKVTGPLSETTSFTYNNYGELETVTNPAGVVTKYEYNNVGYLTKITSDSGDETHINSNTQFSYDPVGNVLSVTDPKGNTMQFEYDALNQLTKTISPLPFSYQTKYSYDSNGNLTKLEKQANETATEWQTTEYEYDALDQLVKVTEGGGTIDEGRTTAFEYDANGNRTKITDAENNSTTYAYDERNLLYKVTDAAANTTEYSYDANANLREIKDAKGNLTTYTYDDFDRLTKTTFPDNTFEAFSYDAAGNNTQKTTRKADTIYYTYDSLNRLIEKGLSPQGIIPDSAASYAYDSLSRLSSVTNSSGTETYSYDSLGRVTTVTYPNSKTVSYQYDLAGNKTKLTYPDASYITYAYDSLNRLTSIKDQTSATIASYTYDSLSRRTNLSLTNGVTTNYTYDSASRLLSLANKKALTTLSSFTYTYDSVGNRLSMTTPKGTTSYTYDNIYQLTKATSPNFPAYNYSYDSLGNRTQVAEYATQTYTSNNLNQYTKLTRGASTTSYVYDLNGNLTTMQSGSTPFASYTYDYENRLTQAYLSTARTPKTTKYTYDPFGRRLSKEVNGILKAKYIYDQDQVIAEYDSNNNLIRKYVFGPNIDEPLLIDNLTSKYYYSLDGLGSMVNLTDKAGTLVDNYLYNEYGLPIRNMPWGTTAVVTNNPYYFCSREYEGDTGLYHYRARYYSHTLGRFLQPDPIGYEGGINLYAYCSNNPLAWVDPFGLCKQQRSIWGQWYDYVNSDQTLSNIGNWGVGFVESFVELKNLPQNLWNFANHPIASIKAIPSNFHQLWSDLGDADISSRTIGRITGDVVIAVVTFKLIKEVASKSAIRLELHGTHGGRVLPHIQAIKGPGWGKTLWRFPPH